MKAEADDVTEDEWLLRRIPVSFWDSPRAFEPRLPGKRVRDPDLTGISLYRESCLHSFKDVLATVDPAKRGSNGIVRIPVALLRELGLTVKIEPDTRVKGHVVIPEMRADAYSTNKASLVPVMLRLAESAKENVVLRPENVGDSPG